MSGLEHAHSLVLCSWTPVIYLPSQAQRTALFFPSPFKKRIFKPLWLVPWHLQCLFWMSSTHAAGLWDRRRRSHLLLPPSRTSRAFTCAPLHQAQRSKTSSLLTFVHPRLAECSSGDPSHLLACSARMAAWPLLFV